MLLENLSGTLFAVISENEENIEYNVTTSLCFGVFLSKPCLHAYCILPWWRKLLASVGD